MKKLILIICCSITLYYSQTIDDAIKGPISGITYTPDIGKFHIDATLAFLSAESMFDDNEDEKSFNDLFDGIANPKQYGNSLNISGIYTLTEKRGIGVGIPIITKQEVEYNPSTGYEESLTDLSGETGLGDISIGGWYQISKNQKSITLATAFYTLATGSSPEDVGESNVSSTGSGHTSIDIGIRTDYLYAPNILVSGWGSYTINQEGKFSSDGISWDEKDGNEIDFSGTVSMLASPQLSLGMTAGYSSAGTSEYDGETVDDSDYNNFILAPKVGYQMTTGSTKVNITGSYLLSISGKNYPKFDGLAMGVEIYY